MAATKKNDIVIYKATSPSGKSYIGISSKSLEHRIGGHLRDAAKKSKFTFHSAINKYGSENISWEVLEKVDSWDKAQERERFYIGEFDTYNNGYNMTLGGEGHLGFKQSEETKRKRGAAISKAQKGRKLSSNHVESLRKAQIGNTNKKGTKLSEESKKKISQAQRHKMKPVICLETNTVFESICAAAREFGICDNNLRKHLRRYTDPRFSGISQIGGFTFEYQGDT